MTVMPIASTFTAGEGSHYLRVGSSSWQERPELSVTRLAMLSSKKALVAHQSTQLHKK